MERVKLPREVAEAIEYIREALQPEQSEEHTLESGTWINNHKFDEPAIQIINDYLQGGIKNASNYWLALKHGYEVQETPEEKVRQLYDAYCKWQSDSRNRDDRGSEEKWFAAKDAVRETLNILGIKIEGVTD